MDSTACLFREGEKRNEGMEERAGGGVARRGREEGEHVSIRLRQ